MKTARHPKTRKWWVIPTPKDPPGTEPMGPYDTKAEAEEDRLGVERFLANEHKPGWVTTDKEAVRRAKERAKAAKAGTQDKAANAGTQDKAKRP